MTQYDDRVEKQRLKIEAEDWAGKVQSLHAHSINSMWYDTRPQDTENGKIVTDKQFNSGLVERHLSSGEVFLFRQDELKGDALIQAYSQNN